MSQDFTRIHKEFFLILLFYANRLQQKICMIYSFFFQNIMKFWLDKGIDGFRIDAVPHLFESANISLDEPPLGKNLNLSLHASLNHTLTKDQPETYELVKEWRDFVDNYAEENKRDEIVREKKIYLRAIYRKDIFYF